MPKSFAEINEKIRKGNVVVITADEVGEMVRQEGLSAAAEKIDIVTTATFGPMCSSGAFLNFGHTDPPIRMEKIWLNDVEAYGGLAAVDTYLGATATSESKGIEYGGAHVICDLIAGKEINLQAKGTVTDCYPLNRLEIPITKDSINEAYLFNPRNSYQNYAAAVNTSERVLHTYMGVLQPEMGNINYSTSGALSPLLNDPTYRTIGIGTRIFFCGTEGYVSWQGTQFNSGTLRDDNGLPLGTGGTLALIGDLKKMDSEFIQPAVFAGYGVSLYVGIGIPIPVLDEALLKTLALEDKDITTAVYDYSVQRRNRPALARVNYAQLRSGSVELNGRQIRTAPLSSLYKAKQIAERLREWILNGDFYLNEPVKLFDTKNNIRSLDMSKARR